MKDDWTEAYTLIMPMVGLAVGIVGLVLTFSRAHAQAAKLGPGTRGIFGLESPTGVAVDVPRVRYSDDQVLVEVRDPGEWHPITGFVQPHDAHVRQLVRQLI